MTTATLDRTDVINDTVRQLAMHANRYPSTRQLLADHMYDDMPGTPPADYWGKAAAFLARKGYTLRHAPLMDGTNGLTAGTYVPEPLRNDPDVMKYPPGTVNIRPGMSPAREFQVIAHEMAHVVLNHPVRDEAELFRAFIRDMTSDVDVETHQEEEAEMASAAVSRAVGCTDLRWTGLYLRQKTGHEKITGRECQRAASAAKIITRVFE